ncbi:F0F1 ATP synthase subunit delta [Hydrogenimonas sp.]|jgi:F-type H+-transporting ATPase subunit delta|uniref:F0F1 ATP synthase subunit delta n=1 Tax=Hydrogenimonas sp. TaxID=2231112 RepID=UPI0026169022|nr:F0F1 ATP synthase subunit delta [Hydrogenimonas sp.]
MDQLVAKRYVKALIEALGEKKMASAEKALAAVAGAFKDPKFAEVIVSPEVSRAQREELIVSLLGEKADPKLVNFVKTLGIHNRFGLIPEIVKLLQKELQRRANKYEGVVESKKPLDKKLLGELESSLSKYVDAKVVLKPVKSERDGIKVMIEDLGLEASFSKERVASDMITHILKAL